MNPGRNARGSTLARHVVVTLDAFEINVPVLERAVNLAARLGARLEGIFVEDIDLIELAGLPFLREVRSVSRSEASMELSRIEQELRVLARRAERMLGEQAARQNVTWSFRVWRGSIDSDLLDTATEADVFALTRLGARLTRLPCARNGHNDVAVLYTGTGAANRALMAAVNLLGDTGDCVNVLLPGDDAVLRQHAEKRLGLHADRVHFVPLKGETLPELLETVKDSGSAVLLLERGHPLLRVPSLQKSLGDYNCPLLIVR